MTLKIAMVGPGRSKQGTGPFIARSFQRLGCEVVAVVSSTLASAEKAVKDLHNQYGITCKAHSKLEELLSKHNIDVVVISSPVDTHMHYLTTAIDFGCHIFSEKPLWWPKKELHSIQNIDEITSHTTELVKTCLAKNILLQLNTQWPFTLPGFYTLYPEFRETRSIESFSIWLSPQSSGSEMIIDTVSHVLSMLYTLCGSGKINHVVSNFHHLHEDQDLLIEFDYLHAFGDTKVSISLTSSNSFPKPAAYAINGMRVDRHVELPDYLISLRSADKQIPLVDPLENSIKNFMSSIHSKTTCDETALIDGMTHLAELYLAITQR